jgi:hydroxyethylthiazole kinase
MNGYATNAALAMRAVREKKPLIHHITNFVVMNETANITLASGALPVMAHAMEEAAEMTGQAAALVLNIGTLWPDQVEAMELAGRRANERGIPVILDPVGAGATAYRTQTALRLLKGLDISLVRGNVAEVAVLADRQAEISGVEAVGGTGTEKEVAMVFAEKFGCAAVVTGPVDVIAGGEKILTVANGHAMMAKVTGTGCMATAVIAAYAAISDSITEAAAIALAAYGLAGQIAAHAAKGPGTFQPLLYDALASLTEDALKAGARINEEY